MKPDHPIFEELTELATNSGWVNGLARRLVADSHLAEDVVQDAWVEALENGEAVQTSLIAWTAGVVRNLARGRTRSAKRRRDREARSARENEVPPASDTTAKLEQQGVLIRKVLELREPYRSTIIRRYIDEVPPRKIAAELDVSVATINSRLARGLEILRERLLREHDGDETQWLSTMVALSGVSSKDGVLLLGALLMKSKTFVATLLCVVLLAGWYTFAQRPSGVTDDSNDLAAVELDDGEPVTLDRTNELLEPDRSGISRDEQRSVAIGETFTIRVVDGVTGEPAPEATVFVLPAALPDDDELAWRRLRYDFSDSYARVIEQGDRLRADAAGELRLPVSRFDSSICATFENKTAVGPRYMFAEPNDLTLQLWPFAEIRTSVKDERGRPLVGIGVAVATSERDTVLDRSVTDEYGEATLRPWLIRDPMFGVSAEIALSALVDVPQRHLWATPVELDEAHRGEVELVCVSFGTLEVELFETEGTHVPDGTPISLAVVDENTRIPLPIRGGVDISHVENGIVRFERVGLDLDLEVTAPLARSRNPWTAVVRGPEGASELVRRRLVVGKRSLAIRGRIVDDDGEPSPGFAFAAGLFHDGDPGGSRWQESTDAEGAFELELVTYDGDDPSGELTITPTSDLSTRIEIRRTIVAPDVGRIIELGDIRFGDEPLPILAGVVLDPLGRPVPDLWVNWVTRSPGSDRFVSRPVEGLVLTDHEGRFTFYGEFGQSNVWLGVSPNRWRHEPVRIHAPSLNIELRLLGAGSVAGKVVADDGVDFSSLVAAVWNLDQGAPGSPLSAGWKSTRLEPDGSFEIVGLDVGTFAFELKLAHDGGRLVFFDTIDVRDDGTTDARVERIDLRGRLRAIDVVMLDGNDRELEADVWFIPDEGRPLDLGTGPRVSVDSQASGALLALPQRKALPAFVRFGSRDHYELRSPAGQEVEIEWAGARPLADHDATFSVMLSPLDRERLGDGLDEARTFQYRLARPEVKLSPKRRSRILLPGPGRYELRWMAESTSGQRSIRPEFGGSGETITIDVSQSKIELAPDADWEAAQ